MGKTRKKPPAAAPDDDGAAPDTGLDRAAILGADDVVVQRVRVPEWGGHVFVRSFTAGQRAELDVASLALGESAADHAAWIARLLVLALCDRDGKTVLKHDDAKKLVQRNSAAVMRVANAAKSLNALDEADVEELEKN